MDVVRDIKAAIDLSQFDFDTAEGRVAFDDVLRQKLKDIRDDRLRSHAAEMLRGWRQSIFPGRSDYLGLDERLAAVERQLGLREPGRELGPGDLNT